MAEDGLEGPFKNNVYIGFSSRNKKTVMNLRGKLETRGVSCCLRPQDTGNVKKSIREGVLSSQKSVIFLTQEYMEDGWFHIETQEMLNKTERFCRDILMILKTDPTIEIPERLQGFKEWLFTPGNLNDDKYITDLVEEVKQEPSIQLAILPKENIGYGAALGFFYGFLHIVLPQFRQKLVNETLRDEPDLLPNTIKKLLIIMPETCYCPPSLLEPGKIVDTEKILRIFADRAGINKRDFTLRLFQLIDVDSQQSYFFVGQPATPLLTMYEMLFYGVCGMTREQLYMERDAFYFVLKAILSHPDNALCKDQVKLLYWSNPHTEKPNQLGFYDFLLPVLKRELQLERENVKNPAIDSAISTTLLNPAIDSAKSTTRPLTSEIPSTFTIAKAPSYIICEPGGRYPLDQRPRGKCVIINIINFNPDHSQLEARRGSEHDTVILTKLFTDLHFNVDVHNDVDSPALEKLLLEMNQFDHSKYNAFVCCILSHGDLGVIYTRDGKPVEILQIVDYFTDKNCPSLKGKPKLFFIQACQKGDPEFRTDSHATPPEGNTDDTSHSVSQAAAGIDAISLSAPSQMQVFDDTDSQDAVMPQLNDNESHEQDATKDDDEPQTRKHKAVLVPGAPDFLMSYSTLPGSVSYRDTTTGCFYIQALNEYLRQGLEIDRALKQVSRKVTEDLRECIVLQNQLPFHLTSGMDRYIYL